MIQALARLRLLMDDAQTLTRSDAPTVAALVLTARRLRQVAAEVLESSGYTAADVNLRRKVMRAVETASDMADLLDRAAVRLAATSPGLRS